MNLPLPPDSDLKKNDVRIGLNCIGCSEYAVSVPSGFLPCRPMLSYTIASAHTMLSSSSDRTLNTPDPYLSLWYSSNCTGRLDARPIVSITFFDDDFLVSLGRSISGDVGIRGVFPGVDAVFERSGRVVCRDTASVDILLMNRRTKGRRVGTVAAIKYTPGSMMDQLVVATELYVTSENTSTLEKTRKRRTAVMMPLSKNQLGILHPHVLFVHG